MRKELIAEHTIDIYGSTLAVAHAIQAFEPRKVRAFTPEHESGDERAGLTIHEYISPTAAAMTSADVCMLDGSSLKVLAVRYPSDAQFILARLALRGGWVLGFPGLVRRMILGRVRIGGIQKLEHPEGGSSYWLLINKTKKTVPNPPLLLPRSIGTKKFFEWMRDEKITYVVPRFYENLPELHREDGDLDLIVADDDAQKVVDYLRSLSEDLTGTTADSIPVGMHSVSLGSGVPYYPPPIARDMLVRAIDGPAGSRIPQPIDAFNAFVYHCLYHHKGYATNIPTSQNGKPEHPPENDYGGIIARKAAELGIDAGSTMEELDEYMERVGWRPKRDTLAKIAQKNAWVRDRFFSRHDSGATGLTVYLLKEFALEQEDIDDIVTHLREDGLHIIRAIEFDAVQKEQASTHIRGGNWVDFNGNIEGMLPAAMIIAVDPKCANLPPAYSEEYERVWAKRRKQQLREAFDIHTTPASLVHAADNTGEAWEYIHACFDDEEAERIRQEVEAAAEKYGSARIARLFSPTYLFNAARFTIRDFVTNQL